MRPVTLTETQVFALLFRAAVAAVRALRPRTPVRPEPWQRLGRAAAGSAPLGLWLQPSWSKEGKCAQLPDGHPSVRLCWLTGSLALQRVLPPRVRVQTRSEAHRLRGRAPALPLLPSLLSRPPAPLCPLASFPATESGRAPAPLLPTLRRMAPLMHVGLSEGGALCPRGSL